MHSGTQTGEDSFNFLLDNEVHSFFSDDLIKSRQLQPSDAYNFAQELAAGFQGFEPK